MGRLPAAAWLARLGEQVGPARLYQESLSGLDRFSDRIHRVEVRDLRAKVAASLADERPPVPHDQVMAEIDAIIERAHTRRQHP